MASKLSIKYWQLSKEWKQAKDYYKFLDDKSVEKIDHFYESGKFSQYKAISQNDPRNAPIIFNEQNPMLRIMRFRPLFHILETALGKEDLSFDSIYFESTDILPIGERFIFEIPFSENIYICASIDKSIKKTTKYLYKAKILRHFSYGYSLYCASIRRAAPTLAKN